MAAMALTNAERQRRFRERRAAGEPVRTVAVARTPKDRRPRPKQWTDAVAVLRRLQGEYEAWRDGLPESLADSRTAELLSSAGEDPSRHREHPSGTEPCVVVHDLDIGRT